MKKRKNIKFVKKTLVIGTAFLKGLTPGGGGFLGVGGVKVFILFIEKLTGGKKRKKGVR